jgi:predicted secreted protein
MTVNALLGQGCVLATATNAAGTVGLTVIGEVGSLSGPTMSSDQIDVTSMESLGGFREKIAGLTDPGELSFDIFYVPDNASHQLLLDLLLAKNVKYWQLQLPIAPGAVVPSGVWQFQASVTAFEADIPVDDAMKASITLTISGLPDWAASAWDLTP